MTIEMTEKPPGRELAVRPTDPALVDRWKRVPTALTPKRIDPDAPAARKTVAVKAVKGTARVAVAPVYDAGWGAVDFARLFFRWLLDADAREQAIAKESLHTYTKVHREAVKQNLIVCAVLLGVLLLGTALLWFLTPGYVKAMLAAAVLLPMILRGWKLTHRNTDKGDTAAASVLDLGSITGPLLTERATAAGRIGKDTTISLLPPGFARDGIGYAGVMLLPLSNNAAAELRKPSEWAGIFEVDESSLVLSRRNQGHARQLAVWVTREDPFGAGSGSHPLLSERSWDVWDTAPFALDARRRRVPLQLIYSNLLIGAKPGAGKTYAARCAAIPFILDPNVRIHVANGKGDKAWKAVAPISDTYISGRRDEHALALDGLLTGIIDDIDQRFARMEQMDDDLCPDSKVTRRLASDPAYGMPITLVLIDELQNYTQVAMPCKDTGYGKKLGESIGRKLTDIAKNGRAAGVVLMMITQRPSAASLPTELRAQVGTRFGLKMMDLYSSNMILGESMNTAGYDTSQLPDYKGIGILVPDQEESGEDLDSYPTARTFLAPDSEFGMVCQRGYDNRAKEGRLPTVIEQEPAPSPERPRVTAIQVEQGEARVIQLRPATAISAAPVGEIAALEAYLDRPGSDFKPSSELTRALGMSAKDLAELMRKLGAEKTRDKDETGARVNGYSSTAVLQAIARMDGSETDLDGS